MPDFAASASDAIPIHVIAEDELGDWLGAQPTHVANWLGATGFEGKLGQHCLIPAPGGSLEGVAFGWGDGPARDRSRLHLGALAAELPQGIYRIARLPAGTDAAQAALGFLFGRYSFDRYRTEAPNRARLIAPEGVDAVRLAAIARAEFLVRDLINTPASDMGPDALEAAARALAQEFGAKMGVTAGDDLLSANLPMIHAVGRASSAAPRLIDFTYGRNGDPLVTLVGKGVCFDTGGLDIKPASSMGLMKKDMGGAANVLGLARMIMGAGLKLRLRVLIPAVENAISGNAFRPGDILTARNGMTVEINNTDAEGRLVLADALALGAEGAPALMVSMATLTGAARVALGADLPPFYTDDAALAQALSAAGDAVEDPLWRMPFWPPYERMIEPGIADLDNAPSGGKAGSITAALFLRRFAGATRYAHFDIYGWADANLPGRTKGGFGQGARAIFAALPNVLSS